MGIQNFQQGEKGAAGGDSPLPGSKCYTCSSHGHGSFFNFLKLFLRVDQQNAFSEHLTHKNNLHKKMSEED